MTKKIYYIFIMLTLIIRMMNDGRKFIFQI